MQKGKKPRVKREEQMRSVRKLFFENDIDMGLVNAGCTLYESIGKAKRRTKNKKSYVKKGIEYRFNSAPLQALLEIIKHETSPLWKEWQLQQIIYDATGDLSYRPTLHRIDANGHYEIDNLTVLQLDEHQREHAIETFMLDLTDLQVKQYDTLIQLKADFKIGRERADELLQHLYVLKDDNKMNKVVFVRPTSEDELKGITDYKASDAVFLEKDEEKRKDMRLASFNEFLQQQAENELGS